MAATSLLQVRVTGRGWPAGHAHGALVADVIRDQLATWAGQCAAQGRDLRSLISDLHGSAGFREAAEHWAPEVLAEVQGIAAGAGLDEASVFALACLDEAWWWGGQATGCSVIGVPRPDDPADDRPLAAQTMDLDAWMGGSQIALVHTGRDGAPDLAMLSRAGMTGLCGANSHGLVVLVNALPELVLDDAGLPVAFVLRLLLECASAQEAANLLRELPHATGQAYTLLDRTGACVGLECGPGSVVPYEALPSGVHVHTNHALASRARRAGIAATPSSTERLGTMIRLGDGPVSPRRVADCLTDDVLGVCATPGRWDRDGWATFGTMIVRPGPITTVRLTAGPSVGVPVVVHLRLPAEPRREP